MVRYLLTTFHGQDEEIEGIHLPAVFAAIAELLSVGFSPLSCRTPYNSCFRYDYKTMTRPFRQRPHRMYYFCSERS